MNTSDPDYIDVSTINTGSGDWRETVAKHTRETVRRFGQQKFNTRHVYSVVFKKAEFSQHKALYQAVRGALNHMVKKNKVEIVTQGEFKASAPTIYRAIQSEESQT